VKFHEYWDNENKLLELSYKESIRQREERRCKNKTSVPVTQKKKNNRGNVVKKKSPML
jgi:hypothetical protein